LFLISFIAVIKSFSNKSLQGSTHLSPCAKKGESDTETSKQKPTEKKEKRNTRHLKKKHILPSPRKPCADEGTALHNEKKRKTNQTPFSSVRGLNGTRCSITSFVAGFFLTHSTAIRS
jgi:hypothetical protein